MTSKRFIFLTLFCLSLASFCFYSYQKTTISTPFPIPTNGETVIKINNEEAEGQNKRGEWIEMMHRTAPDVSWKQMEYQTQMERHQTLSAKRRSAQTRDESETLANGQIQGEWKERGSLNQAGSVFDTYYDTLTHKIFLISAGGTLWKSDLSSETWEVVSEELRFNTGLLEFIPIENGRRIVAVLGGFLHYSDDEGMTWAPSTGIENAGDEISTKDAIVLSDDNRTIYLLSKQSSSANYGIYKSTDKGTTFTGIAVLPGSEFNSFKMMTPHNSNEIYIMNRLGNKARMFYLNQETGGLTVLNVSEDMDFSGDRVNLVGIEQNEVTTFYAYDSQRNVYKSEDFGENWALQGTLPDQPWEVGMYLSPSDPSFLVAGGFESYKSYDAGVTWEITNSWVDYYSDINNSLHADIMYHEEHKDENGQPFLLISNHGGLSVSYDNMQTVNNIGLNGLNVSQYYDVRTDPNVDVIIYAGSQDQGFQRAGSVNQDEILEFEQAISGDYGHMAFTGNGSHMWNVYPGGWISFYTDPYNGGIVGEFTMDSENESVWIPPLMPSPDPSEDIVYMAGGNVQGGPGSYLVQLEYKNGGVNASQYPLDFKTESGGGEISALAHSKVNPDNWYVATTNGRFFYSFDRGVNWEQSINFIPSGHWLYGQTIMPSQLDANTVYYGGSGYSNPGVYVSHDNGQNFSPMNEGLPPTLVFELTANLDETLLFAATEAGPYVYVVADARWYDMTGEGAPNQTYWSVEFVPTRDIVRFGTYGRGIWDFQIEEVTSLRQVNNRQAPLKTFPNPSQGEFFIQSNEDIQANSSLNIFNNSGQVVHSSKLSLIPANQDVPLNLSHLPKGIYHIQIKNNKNIMSQKITLQ